MPEVDNHCQPAAPVVSAHTCICGRVFVCKGKSSGLNFQLVAKS